MGIYLNPGNSGFAEIVQSNYFDKTSLIGYINSTIGTKQKLTCINRPRRFGKSYSAQMLSAYYDKTCESHGLFENSYISKDPSYESHIGKYDVIFIDMAYIKQFCNGYETLVEYLQEKITEELVSAYPEVVPSNEFPTTLMRVVEHTGNKFVVIIDEWDAPIRENPSVEKKYLDFLGALFKSSQTSSKIFAAIYMTGIIQINKDSAQSAVSDFIEDTMIKSDNMGEYLGFTEDEVKMLCSRHNINYLRMRACQNIYHFEKVGDIYNPHSVMQVIENPNLLSQRPKNNTNEVKKLDFQESSVQPSDDDIHIHKILIKRFKGKSFISGIITAVFAWIFFVQADILDEYFLRDGYVLSLLSCLIVPIVMLLVYIRHCLKYKPSRRNILCWFSGYYISHLIMFFVVCFIVFESAFAITQHSTTDYIDLNGIEYYVFPFFTILVFTGACIVFHLIRFVVGRLKKSILQEN